MADVVPLTIAQGSYLCTVSLYRMPDGSIRGALDEMPAPVIEAEANITARFNRIAVWCVEAAQDFLRQGARFDDETWENLEPKP